jgi:hypothetical protein
MQNSQDREIRQLTVTTSPLYVHIMHFVGTSPTDWIIGLCSIQSTAGPIGKAEIGLMLSVYKKIIFFRRLENKVY